MTVPGWPWKLKGKVVPFSVALTAGTGTGLHEGQAGWAQWESGEPSSEAGAGRWCVCRGLGSVCEDGDPCVEVSLPRQWVCWALS